MRRAGFALLLVAVLLLTDARATILPRAVPCLPGIGPVGGFRKVAGGFRFTEGPVCDSAGNLYFTDIGDNGGKIYRLDPCGQLTVVVACSNRANGLAINGWGEIVACEMATGRLVAHSPDGQHARVLADGWCGRRFNAPNDLVIDRHGGIYFTDPRFHSPRPFPPQRHTGVYYLDPAGRVTLLVDDLWNPNGIALSPDESTLYVIPSQEFSISAYPVLAPGRLGPGRAFSRFALSAFPFFPGGDGAAVDCQGNLYVASHRGIQIFAPDGARRGILPVPEQPSNVAFGGPDGKTLYVTARTSVYAAQMLVAGQK